MSAPGRLPASAPLVAWWHERAPREQRALVWMVAAVAVALLWFVALAPAWRIVARAPAQIDAADAQWQQMQGLAAEARELRGTAPVGAGQAEVVLKAATARLGDKGRLALQGDRAVLTLREVGSGALRDWLGEVRTGARARPVEATLTRGPAGLSGTIVVALERVRE
ncbi:MAG: type II secretion system protein M [Burkholderiales bacterium]|nr:type II secretion system protein M [Burkholderiales bacterium]